jgi:3-phosphoshikimate 1-carboxyvinyltransferase
VAVAAAGQGLFEVRGRGRCMHDRPIGELARVLGPGSRGGIPGKKPECPPLASRPGAWPAGRHGPKSPWRRAANTFSGLLLASPMPPGRSRSWSREKKPCPGPMWAVTRRPWPTPGCPVNRGDTEGRRLGPSPTPAAITRPNPAASASCAGPGLTPREFPGRGRLVPTPPYFLAARALGTRPVPRSKNLRRDSAQGDNGHGGHLFALWRAPDPGRRVGHGLPLSPLSGVAIDMGHCPDLVPTVAAAAAMAVGPTTITNVAHLRLKESDRAGRLARQSQPGPGRGPRSYARRPAQSNHTWPPPSERVVFKTYDDHRMAMSMALFGCPASPNHRFDNPGCVAKSFPALFRRIGAKVTRMSTRMFPGRGAASPSRTHPPPGGMIPPGPPPTGGLELAQPVALIPVAAVMPSACGRRHDAATPGHAQKFLKRVQGGNFFQKVSSLDRRRHSHDAFFSFFHRHCRGAGRLGPLFAVKVPRGGSWKVRELGRPLTPKKVAEAVTGGTLVLLSVPVTATGELGTGVWPRP